MPSDRGDAKPSHPMGPVPQQRSSSASGPRMGPGAFSQKDLRRSRPDVVAKVQEAVATRRLRLKETFQDADRLRRGVCTLHQMKVSMAVLGISLDADEFDELYERYRTEDNSFGYRNFCAAVDEALRKHPPTVMRGNKALQEQKQQVQVDELPTLLGARMRQRGVEVEHLLDAFNAANCTMVNHVNQYQFTRVLDRFGFKLNDEQLNILLHAYGDTETGNEVNYKNFCTAIERSNTGAVPSEQASRPPRAPSTSGRSASKYFDMNGNVVPLSSAASWQRCNSSARGPLPRGIYSRQACKAR